MDVSKVSPAPWAGVRQHDTTLSHTGKFILAHGMTAIALFLREDDVDAAALMRNAFAAWMENPHWSVFEKGGKWICDPHGEIFFVMDDPLSAIMAAQEWMREQERKDVSDGR